MLCLQYVVRWGATTKKETPKYPFTDYLKTRKDAISGLQPSRGQTGHQLQTRVCAARKHHLFLCVCAFNGFSVNELMPQPPFCSLSCNVIYNISHGYYSNAPKTGDISKWLANLFTPYDGSLEHWLQLLFCKSIAHMNSSVLINLTYQYYLFY